MIFHKDNTPPAQAAQVDAFESRFGHALPEDYKHFLLQHNGGNPEQQLFRIPALQDNALAEWFLGLGRDHYDLDNWLQEMADDLPEGFLPIAFDPGGNVLLMDARSGKIYYWDSVRHFSRSTDDENTFKIADSFSELLGSLKEIHS